MAGGEEVNTLRHLQSPLVLLHRGESRLMILRLLVAIVIGGVFIYAGALKVWDPITFAGDIQNFRILPWPVGVRLAFYLPWLEIICGLALIVGWLRSGAVAVLTALTVVFIGATIAAKARGIDLECGCFGSAARDLPFAWRLAIDFAIFAGLVLLWVWPRGRLAG